MKKSTKFIATAIAMVLVMGVMVVGILAATTASASVGASVSWTAGAGIEFELEAWVVNNEAQNGIDATSTPLAIEKQVVSTATTNAEASAISGDLSCRFYDGSDDGVNNPSSIIYTYKFTNTGESVILIKATTTPDSASESGATADTHKPAVALSTRINGAVRGAAVEKVIGSEGYKIQPDEVFEYVVVLSIANADVGIDSFDADVAFSLDASSGTTELAINRNDLYGLNGFNVAGINASGTATTYTYYGAYPQTYVGNTLNSALKSALDSGNLESTDWSYFFESGVTDITCNEYYYQGNYYACLESATPFESGYTFTTGDSVSSGQKYFFKVEPLKWENHNGTYITDKVISNGWSLYNWVTWDQMNARTWLNSSFYTESGINLVKTEKTAIVTEAFGDNYIVEADVYEVYSYDVNTQDYIWLITSIDDTWVNKATCTDFAMATGCAYDEETSSAQYWSRYWISHAYMSAGACYVNYYGSFSSDPDGLYYDNPPGIRPCFSF